MSDEHNDTFPLSNCAKLCNHKVIESTIHRDKKGRKLGVCEGCGKEVEIITYVLRTDKKVHTSKKDRKRAKRNEPERH
jgi:hypothetical protein